MGLTPPRLVLVLSENWTLTSPRDLRSLVRMAVEAEDVMITEIIGEVEAETLKRKDINKQVDND